MPFSKPTLHNIKAKILLLGEPGAGKTYGALTFPRPAVIDAEGSVDLFIDDFSFVREPTKSLSEAIRLANDVGAGRVEVDGKPAETLILDSITSLYNTVQIAAMGKDGSIDMQKWGLIKRLSSSLWDILYQKLDVHVICTAWVKPKFTGSDSKTGEMLADGEVMDGDRKSGYAFDLIFKLKVKNGKRSVEVLKARGIFGKYFKAGQKIDQPFSYDLLRPIFEKFADKPKRAARQTEEEAADIDRVVLNQAETGALGDHTSALKCATDAYRMLYPNASQTAMKDAILGTIAAQFHIQEMPKRSQDVTAEQLMWFANELRNSGTDDVTSKAA